MLKRPRPSKPGVPKAPERDWFGTIHHTVLGEPPGEREALERQVADARARRNWGEIAGDTPVASKRGTDAVADAPAPAKRTRAKRQRWQSDPAKKAAIDLWPPYGKPPPELSRKEEHTALEELLEERFPHRKFSATTLDRATGRRKDPPR
jgi:hypothetical protein